MDQKQTGSGPEVDWKCTGCERMWTGSGKEVEWEGFTSAGHLRPAIFVLLANSFILLFQCLI